MHTDRRTRREMVQILGAAGLAACGMGRTPRPPGSSAYATRVLAKGPVGYWRLDEATGPTAADASIHRRDGTYHGAPTRGAPGALRCDSDRAIALAAPPPSYVEVASAAAFSQPASGQGLTVEVWMRPDLLVFPGETADPHVHWLGKGEPGRFEWGFRFYSQTSSRPNRVSAYLWNPSGGEGAGAYFQDALRAGEWIHVVACYDPGDGTRPEAGVSIYKNGVLRGSPATSPGARYASYAVAPAGGSAPLRFGTRDLASFFSGGLDEVAIYPRVLRAEEIQENYAAGTVC